MQNRTLLVLVAALATTTLPLAAQSPKPPTRALAESLMVRLDRGDLDGAAAATAEIDAAIRAERETLAARETVVVTAPTDRAMLATVFDDALARRYAKAEAAIDAAVTRSDARGTAEDAEFRKALLGTRFWVRNQTRLDAALGALTAEERLVALDATITDEPARAAARIAVQAQRVAVLSKLVEWKLVQDVSAQLQADLPAAAGLFGAAKVSAAVAALQEITTLAGRSTPAPAEAYAALRALRS
jgi:hypothetical protein